MSKRLLILEDTSSGLELKLFKTIRHVFYIDAIYRNTWCELFKTTKYRKALRNKNKCVRRIHRLLTKIEPTVVTYSILFLGSKRLVDVASKFHQRYLIILGTTNE